MHTVVGKGERRRTWVVFLKLTESAFTAEADGIQNLKEEQCLVATTCSKQRGNGIGVRSRGLSAFN